MLNQDVSRREFMKITAGVGAALAMPTLGQAFAVSPSKMIGIQVGAISFVDEGTEKVLDVLQERAGVNTLFLAVFTYGRGIAGRQIPGYPLPDHGKQEYDLNYHGGNFATPHPQYYKNTVIKPAHAPDHGDLDILAEVLPAAKKRGMKVICWMEDVFRPDLPNIEKVQERDLYGRNMETLCVNNPNYLNFFTGLVEDFARSYDVDGIMWGAERQGALSDSLGATHDTPPIDPGNVTCFCEFCYKKAREHGVNPDRAKQLLKEAGHANGFETVFWTSTSGSGQMIPVAMAEWIQRDLAKVGIRVKLETFDWITYLSKMFQGLRPGHGAYQLSWGMTTNFWIDIVARSTRQPDKGVNVGWYANPRVDSLLDSARGELDESKRVAIYRQIDRILMEDDAAFLPICNDLNLVVLNPKVKGFVNPPEEWFQLWTPWVEA